MFKQNSLQKVKKGFNNEIRSIQKKLYRNYRINF